MAKLIRRLLQEHLDSPGVVVKTGQSVAAAAEKSFGRASDVTGVVPGQAVSGGAVKPTSGSSS